MKMTEITPGGIYELVDFQGKNGIRLTGRKVRVLETFVERDRFSARKDGVRVMMLKEVKDENGEPTGEFQDDTRYGGEPFTSLIMARDIWTREDADARREKERLEQEERERKRKELVAYQELVQLTVAMRLGIPQESVVVVAHRTTDTDELYPWRGTLDSAGLKLVMEGDPDPEIILAAIMEYYKVTAEQEITATPEALTEIIVGALRKPEPEKEDETEEDA